jgi:hypothetical protein
VLDYNYNQDSLQTFAICVRLSVGVLSISIVDNDDKVCVCEFVFDILLLTSFF